MPARRSKPRRGAQCLGVALLILGLGHAPLPAADYHNIRHHDGPNETCRHHDHLVRWHPDTRAGEDIAVLHWHWLPPGGVSGANFPEQGPNVRAHTPDWFDLVRVDGPQFVPDTTTRCLVDRGSAPAACPVLSYDHAEVGALLRAGPAKPVHAFTATFAPRVRLVSLLQRLTC